MNLFYDSGCNTSCFPLIECKFRDTALKRIDCRSIVRPFSQVKLIEMLILAPEGLEYD